LFANNLSLPYECLFSKTKSTGKGLVCCKKDILDDLDAAQLNELNRAVTEADNNETTGWEAFKKEMNEWKEKL